MVRRDKNDVVFYEDLPRPSLNFSTIKITQPYTKIRIPEIFMEENSLRLKISLIMGLTQRMNPIINKSQIRERCFEEDDVYK